MATYEDLGRHTLSAEILNYTFNFELVQLLLVSCVRLCVCVCVHVILIAVIN